jgi:hypothetical protein
MPNENNEDRAYAEAIGTLNGAEATVRGAEIAVQSAESVLRAVRETRDAARRVVEALVVKRVVEALVVKRCGCGLAYTRSRWDALALVGHHADDVETLEMRNCPCGSTLAIIVPATTAKESA